MALQVLEQMETPLDLDAFEECEVEWKDEWRRMFDSESAIARHFSNLERLEALEKRRNSK